jgi:hypothetical protein
MRYFGTGTEIVIVIAGVVTVDIDLAVVRVPVDVRHVAIGVPRARYID